MTLIVCLALFPTSHIKLTLTEGGWLQPEPSVYPDLLSWDNLAGVCTFCFPRACQGSSDASRWVVLYRLSFGTALKNLWNTHFHHYHYTHMKFSTSSFFILSPESPIHEYWTIHVIKWIFARFYVWQWQKRTSLDSFFFFFFSC